MKRWWLEWPGRLERELEELERAGFVAKIDEAARAQDFIVIDATYEVDGSQIVLQIQYPDLYPYFPIGVKAEGLSLPHHQNPFSKDLCLIGLDTSNWLPSLTAAELLQEQLPSLLATAAPGYVAGTVNELMDGEPITAYMNDSQPGSWIGISDWALPPAARTGLLTVGIEHAWPLRGAVLEVKDSLGHLLGVGESELGELYRSQRVAARWIRLPKRPETQDASKLLQLFCAIDPGLLRLQWKQPFHNLSIDLVGAVFPDELERGKLSDNWCFVVRRLNAGPTRKTRPFDSHLLMTGRDSRSVLDIRVPELRPLKDKTIAVFGLGSIGSTVAIELARARVGTLRLIDRDRLETGNIVRWALGREFSGQLKTDAMSRFLRRNYPYTHVDSFAFNLGSAGPQLIVRPDGSRQLILDGDLLESILGGVDLVLDAAAQSSVSHLLSAECWKRGIPHVWVTTTPGAWGGIVGRAAPGMTDGCWRCAKWRQDDDEIESPLAAADAGIQPAGCLTATFTGAAFDINPIACAAVRMAVATLCAGSAASYPKGKWDIGVVNLRSPDGTIVAPSWSTYVSTRHNGCGHP